jgi:hypothetical protein
MPTKISIEQANELLNKLGAQVAVVADSAEADAAFDVEATITEITPEVPEAQQVDEEAIKAATIGRQMGTLYGLVARTFGITRAQIEGLKQDELVPKLKEIIDSRYSKTEGDLRQQLEEAINANNKLAEDKDAERETAIQELQSKFTERNIVDFFRNEFDKIPKKGGDVSKMAKLAYRDAKDEFNLVWNEEKKEVEFYDKSNPEQRVINGKNSLNANTYLTEFNKAMGNDAPDTSHVVPATVKPGAPSGIVTAPAPDTDPKTAALNAFRSQIEAKMEEV